MKAHFNKAALIFGILLAIVGLSLGAKFIFVDKPINEATDALTEAIHVGNYYNHYIEEGDVGGGAVGEISMHFEGDIIVTLGEGENVVLLEGYVSQITPDKVIFYFEVLNVLYEGTEYYYETDGYYLDDQGVVVHMSLYDLLEGLKKLDVEDYYDIIIEVIPSQ